jgi:serine/threonine protein kinase
MLITHHVLLELGRGGMGVVYLAVAKGPSGFHKLKVVKRIHAALAADADFSRMFLDEARLAARLSHPNIVQTNNVGFEAGHYFLEMEYLEGQSLNAIVRRAATRGEELPLPLHVHVLSQALAGLHHAHDLRSASGAPLGVVHRDVSPHNVMVTYDGIVKVLDFGIAKAADAAVKTRTGIVRGKPRYMAPEQAAGGAVDRRADLWAVGVMLWQALARRPLWDGMSDGEVASAVRRGAVPRPSSFEADVPARLEEVAMRCLSRDPSGRFPSAAEAGAELDAYLDVSGTRPTMHALAAQVEGLFGQTRAAVDEQVRSRLQAIVERLDDATEADVPQLVTADDTVEPAGQRRISSRPPPDVVAALEEVGVERYRIGREVARGGMGRIFEAVDLRHGRPVAIKELLQPGADAARRFAREARITARLQHPSIVPIYEAGRWPTGEPFYAMKLVEGRSLDVVVAEAATSKDRLALLPQLVAVCDALAYAHGRRVIHRDLKPANVLVGAYGETVVIDWGLAKEIGADDDGDDVAVPPSSPTSDRAPLTMVGDAMGTPWYMPPEQARGEPVDARADVYALGALLYHVFAGRKPYATLAAHDVLARVVSEPPAPLSELTPDLPADLVTVVEKAMARDPADRYEDAHGLADDLKRFAKGALVSAHTYSMGALVRRWVARYKLTLAVAAAMLVVLAVTGAVGIARIVRERDRADYARALAQREEHTAVVQRNAAEGLVEFILRSLRPRLAEVGRLDVLHGIGAEVDKYYETTWQGHTADVGMLLRRAAALDVLEEVEQSEHHLDDANAIAQSELRLLSWAQDAEPKNAEPLYQLAVTYARASTLDEQRGQLDVAGDEAKDSVTTADRLIVVAPSDPRGRSASGRAWSRMAAIARLTERNADAEAAYAHARDDLRQAVDAAPDSMEPLRFLVTAYLDDAVWKDDLRRLDEAEGELLEAIALCERAIAKSPGQDEATLARLFDQLAGTQMYRGELESSAASMRRAIGVLDALVEKDPENVKWRSLRATSYINLCQVEKKLGAYEQALADCEHEAAFLDDDVKQHPDARSLHGMAYRYWVLGELQEARERLPDARDAYDRARGFMERVFQDNPEARSRDGLWFSILLQLARTELGTGRPLDQVRARARDARARAEDALQANPDDAANMWDLAEVDNLDGDIAAAARSTGEAERAYRSAIAGYDRAHASITDDPALVFSAAKARASLSQLLARVPGRRADVTALRQEIVAMLAPLVDAHRLDPSGAEVLQDARKELARNP